jgi:hypothetical protein
MGTWGCALGTIALPTQVSEQGFKLAATGTRVEAGEAGVKGGSKRGQRGGLEGRSLPNPHVSSAARRDPAGGVLGKEGSGGRRSRANRPAGCS